jgi:hypothetical protein
MHFKGQPESLHANGYQHQQAATLLRDQILSFRNTQLLAVAAKLNIAEHLKDGAKTTELLAGLIDANGDALYRLMRALASLGVFYEHADRSFSNNQTSELLLDSTPGSLRSIAILYGEPWLWSAYGMLMHSVQTGQPAFSHVHGKPMYEFFQADLGASEVFNKAMSAFSDIEAEAIIKAYNFSLRTVVVDVGGGEGVLVDAIVNAYPNLKGIVFDMLPVDGGRSGSDEAKISYVQGDFFAEVPRGGDVYILKSVLHNWDDDSCISILKNCRKGMLSTSSVLVIERVVPGSGTKSDAKVFDINMLVMVGGKERTEDEYRKIFREAGFTLKRVIHTQSSLSIVEAIPG